jgi:hypothetical protein
MSDGRRAPPHAPSDAQKAWAVHLRAVRALRALVLPCAREGIPVLPVKGIITGPLLYGDTAERPMLDCDVRVRPRDLERTLRIARREGFVLAHRMRAYRSAMLTFEKTQVDVETAVGPPGLCALSVVEMLRRATASDLLGFPHLVPELHDHVLLLCVNVFKDKLKLAHERPLEDLRRAVRLPAFSRRTFAERVHAARSTSLVRIVADYIHTELGDDAWGRVLSSLGPSPRPSYCDQMAELEQAESGATGSPGSLGLRLLSRVASDSVRQRAEAVTRMAFFGVERFLKR